jgi:hypothetical protein
MPRGARRQDILAQFLIEAVTVSLTGASSGLRSGFGMSGAFVEREGGRSLAAPIARDG